MVADDMICLKDGEGGSNDLIEVDKNAPDHEKSERKSAKQKTRTITSNGHS